MLIMENNIYTNNNERSVWTRPLVLLPAALFCCFLWGSASPAIKIGYQWFGIAADDAAGRILFAGVRFMIAGLMVIIFDSIKRKQAVVPRKGAWGKVLLLSVFQTSVHYILFYMGLAHTSGVRGSIINAAGTFFGIFLAVAVFRFEKMSVRKAVGSIIGFLGIRFDLRFIK